MRRPSHDQELKGLPEVGARRLTGQGCVRASLVHDSDLVQVTAWHCVRDGESLRAERTQTHHVLTLLRAGACSVEQGRWSAMLDPCTALLHLPGSTYRTLHPFGHGDSGWSLAFAADIAEELLDRAGTAARRWSRPARTRAVTPAQLLPQVISFQRAERRLPVDALEVDELALELLDGLLPRSRDRTDIRMDGAQRRLAERASAHVGASFRERVRLADVARAVGCSPFHLCRVFRRHRGTTLAAHVRNLRLSHVVDALADGRSSLTELALEAGFSSHAHLSDTFGRAMGLSPSRVRSLLRSPASKILKAPELGVRAT